MQITIQVLPCLYTEFEYSTSSSSGYSMVYSLIQHLSKLFGDVASIDDSRLQPSCFQTPSTAAAIMSPTYLYDRRRKQWISDKILDWLLQIYNPDSNTKVLAVCDFDAYSGELNFVLGQAHLGGKVAVIYLSRLRQDFYGKKSDINKLFEQRVIKEAVHELGHSFGLIHCEKNKCVMHFSNSLQDTDFKHDKFCERCNKILSGKLSG